MALNPKKSKCMLIGTKPKIRITRQLHLMINGVVLESVTDQKLLGIHIDNTLNWHLQIDNVCKKLITKIALLKKISYFLQFDMKLMFYNAYILPVMDYCSIIWGKGNTNYINKIYRLQSRIGKIILQI